MAAAPRPTAATRAADSAKLILQMRSTGAAGPFTATIGQLVLANWLCNFCVYRRQHPQRCVEQLSPALSRGLQRTALSKRDDAHFTQPRRPLVRRDHGIYRDATRIRERPRCAGAFRVRCEWRPNHLRDVLALNVGAVFQRSPACFDHTEGSGFSLLEAQHAGRACAILRYAAIPLGS